MKLSTLLVTFFILVLVELTCLHYLGVFQVKPDLFLLFVFISALFFPLRWSISMAVLAGVFKDALGMGSFGINIVLFSLWSILIKEICHEISIDDNLTRMLFIFVIALVHNIINGLVAVYLGSFIPLGIFLRIVLLGSLYTALLLPLILKLTKANIYD